MTAPESHVDQTAEGQAKKTSVVKPVIGLVAVAIAGWASYVWATGVEDGFDFRRFAMLGEKKPLELFAADGEVYFNGKAVDVGHVEAVPQSDPGADRLFAPIKPGGSFKFYTDVGGRLNTGLPAGEYKLLLKVMHPSPPLTQPGRKFPDEYYMAETTPLTITVTTDPTKNHFVIKKTGEIQPNPHAAAMAAGGGGWLNRSADDEKEPPADDKKEKVSNEANEKVLDAETEDEETISNDASDTSHE